ncbi:hypothetical protein MSG28_009355 [Choristoneura fumiferana]|uniref:Uncharacterized protein n=1 Tax=Choristoneura fumiferana TaxID=7141 RepID=A0ACC0KYC9_CHOFU|nr:hypothetical protein MSG28_009355 [Choristoneura fumiferana]
MHPYSDKSGLISRKKELLKLREVVKRKQKTEIKDGSDEDSDIVEDSDADIPPIISRRKEKGKGKGRITSLYSYPNSLREITASSNLLDKSLSASLVRRITRQRPDKSN